MFYFNTLEFVRDNNVKIYDSITAKPIDGAANNLGGYAFNLADNGVYRVSFETNDHIGEYFFCMVDGVMQVGFNHSMKPIMFWFYDFVSNNTISDTDLDRLVRMASDLGVTNTKVYMGHCDTCRNMYHSNEVYTIF